MLSCFFLFRRIFLAQLFGQKLNHLLFQIDVERQLADKGKEPQVFPILVSGVRKGFGGGVEFGPDILF